MSQPSLNDSAGSLRGMGLRFYRRVRIAPGFTLNLGRRGASLSFGRRGAHVTVGHGRVRETVGLPGTGLYYTTQLAHGPRPQPIASGDQKRGKRMGSMLVALVVLYVIIRLALHALALH